jgi:ABC-type phosphate/phosphonate transport system substrate-binding protein
MSLAVLAMYDWPELQNANDQLWAGIASRLREDGIDAPGNLSRDFEEEAPWRSPDLLLGQTCGYPYVKSLRGKVRLVATPNYDADGCSGPEYSSWILVRQGSDISSLASLRRRKAAVNHYRSHSGWNALRATVPGSYADIVVTGSHLNSMAAVGEGRADFCATDGVCWALARRYRPDIAAKLRVIGQSQMAPGLPYITAGHRSDTEVEALRRAINGMIDDPDLADARETVLLDDISILDDTDYGVIETMERRGVSLS